MGAPIMGRRWDRETSGSVRIPGGLREVANPPQGRRFSSDRWAIFRIARHACEFHRF